MTSKRALYFTILVAALGYFVDIFDLLLFSIVRIKSLESLGVTGNAATEGGILLLNIQMAGLLTGGVLWGVLGDKKGRLSVLFGSIFLYSIANLANAFVVNIEQYAVLRFIAGIGLAGELGAGITLVAELLPKSKRGIGTTIVASLGILGAVFANITTRFCDWRTAYLIGGGLGICLLILRIGVAESHLFDDVKKQSHVARGQFLKLLTNSKIFLKYLSCILIGIPVWYVVGILITFSPEFSKELGVLEQIKPGDSVMWCYLGLSLGDLASGFLSQKLRSRKKVILLFILLTVVFSGLYFMQRNSSAFVFYSICFLLGFGSGYWAVLVTVGAEQFGTNLRATVATTVPNFIRGAVIPLTELFKFGKNQFGILNGGILTGVITVMISIWAWRQLEESFEKDLNYIETL